MSATQCVNWGAWLAQWERFQAVYAPERDAQFDVISRYAFEFGSGGFLRAVDLCAGPGSLGARLLACAPTTRIVAVDIDPFLIELGRRGRPSSSIEWVHADLRLNGWSAALPRPYDVALCSTAMPWFNDEQTRAIYRETAAIIRPGGALLVADTMPHGTARVRAMGHAMLEHFSAQRIAVGEGESWVSFWRAAEDETAFAELLTERKRVLGRRGPHVAPALDFHLKALADAGFTDVGEVWRRDAWAVVLAIL